MHTDAATSVGEQVTVPKRAATHAAEDSSDVIGGVIDAAAHQQHSASRQARDVQCREWDVRIGTLNMRLVQLWLVRSNSFYDVASAIRSGLSGGVPRVEQALFRSAALRVDWRRIDDLAVQDGLVVQFWRQICVQFLERLVRIGEEWIVLCDSVRVHIGPVDWAGVLRVEMTAPFGWPQIDRWIGGPVAREAPICWPHVRWHLQAAVQLPGERVAVQRHELAIYVKTGADVCENDP